jgi:hypothetical protein
MAQKDSKKDQDLTTVDNVEVASLTDEDLDTVAGGGQFTQPAGAENNATTGCPITNNASTGC